MIDGKERDYNKKGDEGNWYKHKSTAAYRYFLICMSNRQMRQYINNKKIDQFTGEGTNDEENGIKLRFVKMSGKIRKKREQKQLSKTHGNCCYSGMKESGRPTAIIKKVNKNEVDNQKGSPIYPIQIKKGQEKHQAV